MTTSVAIIANPMSGQDVRRVAARAPKTSVETKRGIIARIATGLDAMGVDEILIARDPFRIAAGALEAMPLRARVRVVDVPLTHTARDTEAAARAAREAGCVVVVALGGDGTHRVIARAWPDVLLVPLSTGTNNVFPVTVEPTSAGVAAGLVARGLVPPGEAASRCKLVRVSSAHWEDLAVVDAVLLRDDHTGNLLPFDPERIAALVLTRAEPSAVGMSPIGGYLDPVGFEDDCGLALRCGAGQALQAPISPGLFRTVHVRSCERLPLGADFRFDGPGVVAFDGDREHALQAGESAEVSVVRDGPPVIDVPGCIRLAAQRGLFVPAGTP